MQGHSCCSSLSWVVVRGRWQELHSTSQTCPVFCLAPGFPWATYSGKGVVEGQTAASLLPKLALLAGAHVPRGALLTCSMAPSALAALSPPGPHSSWWDTLSLDTSALQWVFLGNLGVILTGANPFLHRLPPTVPGEAPIPAQTRTCWMVGLDTACTQRGLTVSDERPVSCKAGFLHLYRAGWGLYFQLMLHPEKAACCRWSEIIGFLPA